MMEVSPKKQNPERPTPIEEKQCNLEGSCLERIGLRIAQPVRKIKLKAFGMRECQSLDQPVIGGVVADPKPEEAICGFDCKGSVTASDTGRPEAADLLEHQQGMARLPFQEFEVLFGESPGGFGQGTITLPERRCRKVHQSSLARPA